MHFQKDVVIVGGGIAGLYTALMLPKTLEIAVIIKGSFKQNNSYFAQGGIAACTEERDIPIHIQDTLVAGGELCNKEAVDFLVRNSKDCLTKLIQLGVPFDQAEDGTLETTKEGGHSARRIFHANKDATGKALIQTLYKSVSAKKNISVYEEAFALDLIHKENKCFGIYAVWKNKKIAFKSKVTILSTGGIGQIYKNTTNPISATGDGIAIAKRAGVRLRDMEFVQFHPTAFYKTNEERKQHFLISEAVRGEGAILKNIYGKRFMENLHPLKELAPRDIVARAIFKQMKETKSKFVYLDLTHKDADYIKNRFPNIYEFCMKENIDITKESIPVIPVQHYFMGGIAVDLYGKTSMENLYACGECSNTGVHGSNRLASNSLSEALVFGNEVAKEIEKSISLIEENKEFYIDEIEFSETEDIIKIEEIYIKFQEIMTNHVGIVRRLKDLQRAEEEVEYLIKSFLQIKEKKVFYYEVYNMLLVGKEIISSAKNRTESCGSHYIECER